MDRGKQRAVLEWINCLGVGECLESLDQLRDGGHLFKIALMVEKELGDDPGSPAARFKKILTSLEACSKNSLDGIVSVNNITDGSLHDLAKLTVLLLVSGIVSDQNSFFIDCCTKLDLNLQYELRHILERILGDSLTAPPSLDLVISVLAEPLDVRYAIQPNMTSTPAAEPDSSCPNNPSTPSGRPLNPGVAFLQDGSVYSNSFSQDQDSSIGVLSRFCSPQSVASRASMSPVHQAVRSPGVANKIRMLQREKRIRQLEKLLSVEQRHKNELEDELRSKEVEIREKDAMTQSLQDKLMAIRRESRVLQTDLDTMCNVAEEKEELEGKMQRYQSLLNELKEEKERSKQLHQENAEFAQQLQDVNQNGKRLEAEKKKLVSTVVEMESVVEQMRKLVREREEEAQVLARNKSALEEQLNDMRQEFNVQKMSTSLDCPGTPKVEENLGSVVEMVFQEKLGLLESEREELLKKLSALQSDFDRVNKELSHERESVEVMKYRESEMQQAIDSLRHDYETEVSQKSALEMKSQELQQTIQAAREQIERTELSHKQEKEQLERNFQETTAAYNVFKAQAEEHITTVKTELQANVEQVKLLNEEIEKRGSALYEAEEKINLVETTLREKEEMFAQEKENLVMERHELVEKMTAECEVACDRVKEEMIKMKQTFEEERASAVQIQEDLQAQNADMKQEAAALEARYQQAEKEITEVLEAEKSKGLSAEQSSMEWCKKADDLERKITDLTVALEDSNEKLEARNTQLKQQSLERQAAEEKCADLELWKQKAERTESSLLQATATLETQQKQMAAIDAAMKEKSKQCEMAELKCTHLAQQVEQGSKDLQASVMGWQMKSGELCRGFQTASEKCRQETERREKLEAQCNELEAELKQMNERLDKTERERGLFEGRTQELDDALYEAQQVADLQVTELQSKVEEMEAELDSLKEKLQQQEDGLNDALLDLTDERQEKETWMHQAEAQRERTARVEKALHEANEQIGLLETERDVLEAQINNTTEEYEAKVQHFEQQFHQAKSNNDILEDRTEKLQESLMLLENGLKVSQASSESTKIELQASLQEAENKRQSLQKELEHKRGQYDTMVKKCADNLEKVERMESVLRQFQQDASDTADSQVKGLQAEIERLQKENERLQHQDERAEHLDEQLRDAEEVIMSLEGKLSQVKGETFTLQESLNQTQMMVSRKEESHLSEMRVATSKQQELENDLRQAETFANEVKKELTQLNESIQSLSQELESTTIKNQELQESLNVTVEQAEVLKNELENKKREIEEAESKVKDLSSSLEDSQNHVRELKTSLERSQMEISNLTMEAESFKDRSESMIETSSAEVERMKEDVTKARMEVAEATERSLQLENKLSISRREVEGLEEQLSVARNRSAKLEEDLREARMSNSGVEQDMKNELREVYAKEQKMEEALDETQDALRKAEIQVESTQAVLEAKSKRLMQVEVQLQERENRAAALEQQCAEAQLKSSQLEGQVNVLEGELKENANIVQMLGVELDLAKEEVGQKNQEVADLEGILDVTRAKAQSLESALKEAREATAVEKNDGSVRVGQMQQEMQRLESEVEQLRKWKEESRQRLNALNEEMGHLNDEREDFQVKAAGLEAILVNSEQEKAALQEELHSVESSSESIIDQMRTQLEDIQQQLTRSSEQFARLEKEGHDQLFKHSQETERLKTRLKEAHEKLEERDVRIGELTDKVLSIEQSKDQVRERLQKESSTVHERLQESEQQRLRFDRELRLYIEREKKTAASHQKEMAMASDMNRKLGQKVQEQEEERKSLEDRYAMELGRLRSQLDSAQQKIELREVQTDEDHQEALDREVSKWQKKCEQLSAKYNKAKECLQAAGTQYDNLKETASSYKAHYTNKKEQLQKLQEQCEITEQKKSDLDKEVIELKGQLRELEKSNKHLITQLRNLEVQLQYANTQLSSKEAKSGKRETTFSNLADSFEESDQMSFNDLHALGRSPSLPARLDKLGLNSPAAKSGSSSISSSSSGVFNSSFVAQLPGPITRARKSRLSLDVGGLGPSGPNVGDHVPLGMRALLSSEDEPEDELEWGRLTELQRRNTLCLPHLKTSYPVETQRRAPREMTEDDMKHAPLSDNVFSLSSSQRKRPAEAEGQGTPDAKRKVTESASNQTEKPKEESSTFKKPPKDATPKKQRWTFRKGTPKKSSNEENETAQPKDSTMFNIGFTPKKSRKMPRFMAGSSSKKAKTPAVEDAGSAAKVRRFRRNRHRVPFACRVSPSSGNIPNFALNDCDQSDEESAEVPSDEMNTSVSSEVFRRQDHSRKAFKKSSASRTSLNAPVKPRHNDTDEVWSEAF